MASLKLMPKSSRMVYYQLSLTLMYDQLCYDRMDLTIFYSLLAITPHNYPRDDTKKPA